MIQGELIVGTTEKPRLYAAHPRESAEPCRAVLRIRLYIGGYRIPTIYHRHAANRRIPVFGIVLASTPRPFEKGSEEGTTRKESFQTEESPHLPRTAGRGWG